MQVASNSRRGMSMNTLWTLPVPSTAFLEGGPIFEKRLGREIVLHFSYESEDDAVRTSAVVFQGVEAFKCTYFGARDASMLEAYDKLVDRGGSAWLDETLVNLKKNGSEVLKLVHLMISFDDGPTYEVVCREFHVEDRQGHVSR
jgi:hypothetical protein